VFKQLALALFVALFANNAQAVNDFVCVLKNKLNLELTYSFENTSIDYSTGTGFMKQKAYYIEDDLQTNPEYYSLWSFRLRDLKMTLMAGKDGWTIHTLEQNKLPDGNTRADAALFNSDHKIVASGRCGLIVNWPKE
jgi:hypothetical protein